MSACAGSLSLRITLAALALLPTAVNPAARAQDGWAVVRVTVAPLRREPRFSAEMVDQAILGDSLRLREHKGGWYRVRTAYDYQGWISASALQLLEAEELERRRHEPQLYFTALHGRVRAGDGADAEPLCAVVLGARLRGRLAEGAWTRVILPDGRPGCLPTRDLAVAPPRPARSAAELVALARSLQGIPYLWGGRSSCGFDCSGFVHTLFALHGHMLPRDSYLQARSGSEVAWKRNFENVRAGDLLFFGPRADRITHVAFSLGGALFIHCSGDVHIASLDPGDRRFAPHRLRTLRAIRRILPD